MKGVLDFSCTLRPGDIVAPVKTGLDRCGHIVTGGNTLEEAAGLADAAEAALQIRIRRNGREIAPIEV